MDDSRTVALLGPEAAAKLKRSAVAIFGVGGVGSFAAEALARAGVGTLVLIDHDVVKPSNCNRQLVALTSTVGMKKVDVMKARILDINPDARVVTHDVFYGEETSETLFCERIDFAVDAIDSLPSKEYLILECNRRGVSMISSMGAGNKLYPERFSIVDLFETKCDPIARLLRRKLRNAGIESLPVVCSDEPPRKTLLAEDGKRVPASISFVPSVCGLLMAGYAVRRMAGVE